MLIIKTKNNVLIRLTKERWRHITARHPEIDGQKEDIIKTISEPDMILEGDLGELIAVRHYEKTPLTTKYLMVVYKETSGTDGFVVTAYYTAKPSERRKVIWKR
jgi:hypothetical protein